MKAMPLCVLWTVTAVALPLAVCAFDAPKQTINVSIGDVTDSRTTGSFFSECKLELKLTGDAATDAASVRQVRVKTAVDELGRDLSRKDDQDSFHSFSSSQSHGVLKTELRLRNPSRNASLIKLVDGEVELFNPSVANGAVVVVKDILKQPGEPVANDALKKYGIQVIHLTKESYEAKKKQLADQQKPESEGKVGEVFGDLFKGMIGSAMNPETKNSVKLYVKDPEKRLVDLEFQDSTGKALKTSSRWSMGELRQFEFKTPPPADAQLLIHLATPEALRSFAFKIENIPLP